MSLTQQIRTHIKLDADIFVDFPAAEPEFKLKFKRFAEAELSFVQTHAIVKAKAEGANDNLEIGLFLTKFLGQKLKDKLVNWEHESLDFSAENKDAFFDSLALDQLQDLLSAYNRAVDDIKKKLIEATSDAAS